MSGSPEIVTPALVRGRFEGFGRSLTEEGSIAAFEVNDDDGVRLTLHRKVDGKVASVEMTRSTEVYFLVLDGAYRISGTAYEPTEKWEVIEDYLDFAALFLRREYVEEVWERNGRVVARSIRFGDGGISARASLMDRARRMLGSQRSVRRP